MQKTTFQKLNKYIQQVDESQGMNVPISSEFYGLTVDYTVYNKTLNSRLENIKKTFEEKQREFAKDNKTETGNFLCLDPLIKTYESYFKESQQKSQLMQGELFYLSGTLETFLEENQELRKRVSVILRKVGDFESQTRCLKRRKTKMSAT